MVKEYHPCYEAGFLSLDLVMEIGGYQLRLFLTGAAATCKRKRPGPSHVNIRMDSHLWRRGYQITKKRWWSTRGSRSWLLRPMRSLLFYLGCNWTCLERGKGAWGPVGAAWGGRELGLEQECGMNQAEGVEQLPESLAGRPGGTVVGAGAKGRLGCCTFVPTQDALELSARSRYRRVLFCVSSEIRATKLRFLSRIRTRLEIPYLSRPTPIYVM